MEIAFRVDGGGQALGLGHLMRCISVANVFRKHGHDCFFVSRNFIPGIQLLAHHGFDVLKIPQDVSFEEDQKISLEFMREADLVFVDGYPFSTEYLNYLFHQTQYLVYFDDLIDRQLPVNAVIGNAYATQSDYEDKTSKDALVLTGASYIPLRSEFHKLSSKKISQTISRVLLTFGGEDPLNVTVQVVKALQSFSQPLKLEILIGLAYQHENELQNLLKQIPHEFQVHYNLKDVLSLYQQVDVAITAAGTTLWELAAAGVPMLIIQTAENQKRNALFVQEQGLGDVLGWIKSINASRIQNALHQLLDPRIRLEYSQRCQSLVDGEGAERIYKALMDHVSASTISLKQADSSPESSDSRLLWEWRNDPLARAMSQHSEIIPWTSHVEWYKNAMLNPNRLLLIAYKGTETVGTIRLDVVGEKILEVSININPNMRGKGLGQKVLKAACEKGFSLGAKQLLAKVKQENSASIKIFENEGFKLVKTIHGLRHYQLEEKNYDNRHSI